MSICVVKGARPLYILYFILIRYKGSCAIYQVMCIIRWFNVNSMLIRLCSTRNPNNLGGEPFTKYTEKKTSRHTWKCGVERSHSALYAMCVEVIQILTWQKSKNGVRISRFVGAEGRDSMKYLIGFKGVQNNLLANLNVAGQLIAAVPFNNPIISFRIMHVSQDLLSVLYFHDVWFLWAALGCSVSKIWSNRLNFTGAYTRRCVGYHESITCWPEKKKNLTNII